MKNILEKRKKFKDFEPCIVDILENLNWLDFSKKDLNSRKFLKIGLIKDSIKHFFPFAKFEVEHYDREIDDQIDQSIIKDWVTFLLYFEDDTENLELRLTNNPNSRNMFLVNWEGYNVCNVILENLHLFIYSMIAIKKEYKNNVPKNNSKEKFKNRKRKVDALISKF